MPKTSSPTPLVAAVRRAVDGANSDFERMPFFVRPLARRSFAARTGYGFDVWARKLDAIRADDTPASVRARWPDISTALQKLAENFRTAPTRAREKMSDPAVLAAIDESSKVRLAAVEALVGWLND